MAKSKVIVLWGSDDLLSLSIEILLAAQQDWKVVRIMGNEDLDALIMAVETVQPDILIIHETFHNGSTKLPLQFLQKHPAIRVITISLENNAMEVYSQQKIMVEQATDLIAAIENVSTSFGRFTDLG